MSKPRPRRKVDLHPDLDLTAREISRIEKALNAALARDGKVEGAYNVPPDIICDQGLIILIDEKRIMIAPEGFEIAPGILVFSGRRGETHE